MLRALTLLLLATPALAQDVKPRILLVFDTSGSMGFEVDSQRATGGDNSVDYPGDGGTSRLFVAKEVIRGIVETTSEVEFGLMRYPQMEGADLNDGTGRQQFTSYRDLDQNPLNYQGFCAGDVAEGEDPWALATGFAADNENEILSWMDHVEDYPANKELRAEGPTPLGESLRLAEDYYTEVIGADADRSCRENFVVLLTDGAESCIPQNQRQAQLLERTLALRTMRLGVPAVAVDVRVFVVAFAVDPSGLSLLDGIARAGGTAVDEQGELDLIAGRAYQASDRAGLRQAFTRILAEAIPTERCNGADDDCDGVIDEGALNACGGCGAPPAEVCNELDDDCDGLTDEGVRNVCGFCGEIPEETCNEVDDDCDGVVDEEVQNACGGCAAVRDEVCNGRDDDCDGRVDNVPGSEDPVGRPCSIDLGACRAGQELCVDGAFADCNGVTPIDEICNGEDDDCDGSTDEISRPCGPAVDIGDVGSCRVGVLACEGAAGWSEDCQGGVGPAEEVCDGLDNDCDGGADEGLFNACGVCGALPPESCNGEDDNCDGRIDEDAACPRGFVCYYGDCVQPCDASGECSQNNICLDAWPGMRFCHPDACAGAECPAGQICDDSERRCINPCDGIDCPAGEACQFGVCAEETCRHVGCPEGERCRAEACEADPCHEVVCGDAEFCREGACVAACRGVLCEAGFVCVDGECEADPCGGRCLRGQVCDPVDGACAQDRCAHAACPAGTVCVEGDCLDDAPCLFIDCPGGTRCFEGTCTDFTPAVDPLAAPPRRGDAGTEGGDAGVTDAGLFDASGLPDVAVFADARPGAEPAAPTESSDGGCGCRSGEAPAPWWLLFGLLGLRSRKLRFRLRSGAPRP